MGEFNSRTPKKYEREELLGTLIAFYKQHGSWPKGKDIKGLYSQGKSASLDCFITRFSSLDHANRLAGEELENQTTQASAA